MIAAVKAIAVLLLATIDVCQPCPKKCYCRQNEMTCRGLSEFPQYIPESTEKVVFWNIQLDEIPSGAFDSLPNVTSIDIYKSEINYLKGCTFSFLSNMDSLTLHSVRIREIEPFAYHALSNIEKITLYNISVDVIHPNAFFNISHVKYFDFQNVTAKLFDSYAVRQLHQIRGLYVVKNNIKKLKNNAFFDLAAVKSFHFSGNRIGELQCRTVESLSMALTTFYFNKNEMECSCTLSWLLPHVRNPRSYLALRSPIQYNWCKRQGQRVVLSKLTAADLNCGEETPGYCFSSSPPMSSAQCGHVFQEVTTTITDSATTGVYSNSVPPSTLPPSELSTTELPTSFQVFKTEKPTVGPVPTNITETISFGRELLQNESNNSASSTSVVTSTSTQLPNEVPTIKNLPVSKKPVFPDSVNNGLGFRLGTTPLIAEMTQSNQVTATSTPKMRMPTTTVSIPVPAYTAADTITIEAATLSPAPLSTETNAAAAVGGRRKTGLSTTIKNQSNSRESGIMDDRQAFDVGQKRVVKTSGHEGDKNSGEATLSSVLSLFLVSTIRYVLL